MVNNLVGNEYEVLEPYVNSSTKIKMKHTLCGHVWSVKPSEFIGTKNRIGTRCPECAKYIRQNGTRLNFEDIKRYIEVDSDSGCELLSTEYQNNETNLTIRCKCGKIYNTTFRYFKFEGKRQCNECGELIRINAKRLSYEEVLNYINQNTKYKLLSNEYINSATPLLLECNEGHMFYKRLNDLKDDSGCPYCSAEIKSINSRLSFAEVKECIESEGNHLLSTKYTNSKEKLQIVCSKGHYFNMSFSDFKYSKNRCPICHQEDIFNEYMDIEIFLRDSITQWKKDSTKQCNYKCVITNESMDDIHHLYSFNNIVKETMENLNIPIYEKINMYTKSELELMQKKCLELHYKYGLGVCLQRRIHRLFHSIYGVKNNSQQQFEEFKEKILNKEILI